ncbi:MAG: thioredoxin family protein [Ignavibacteriaceae bacterium]
MEWLTNLEQAKEEAMKLRKPILLQFELDKCGGCRQLYKTTYPDPEVEKELNEWFVLLKLDILRDKEIRRKLGAYWTPSLYFLDHKENSYYHFNGYLPPEDFRIMLRLGLTESMMPRGRYDEIIEIVEKDLDEFNNNILAPKLMVQKEMARYIKTKDNSKLRSTLKEIQKKYPDSIEAKMYFWDE